MLHIRRTSSRWPNVPPLAAAVAIAWLALVAIATFINREAVGDSPISTCLLRACTGVPCPGCGGTRAALAASRGDVLGAFRLNPLVTALAAAAIALLILRIGFRRAIAFARPPSRAMRTALWLAAFVLVGVQWAWIIWRDASPG